MAELFHGGGGHRAFPLAAGGEATVFAAMVESLFAMAKLSVEVMVLLFGTLTLWLGFLRIAEKAGWWKSSRSSLARCSAA